MQEPHNSVKKQVILKKSKSLSYLTFYRKNGVFIEPPGPALKDEIKIFVR